MARKTAKKPRFRQSDACKVAKMLGLKANVGYDEIASVLCEKFDWPNTGRRSVIERYINENPEIKTLPSGRQLQQRFKARLAVTTNPNVDFQGTPEKPHDYDYINSDAFLRSFEWRRVRMEALKLYGARCQCCGASPKDGIVLHVDHVKPRRRYPELALKLSNLQVLCEPCNHGKCNDETDWR